jgi:hypothetical protein
MLPLEKEFEFFVINQADLVKKYQGKFIVIKNEKVIGVFDDLTTAIAETSKKEKLGTFLVQKCEPGRAVYTQTFHSRVLPL